MSAKKARASCAPEKVANSVACFLEGRPRLREADPQKLRTEAKTEAKKKKEDEDLGGEVRKM